MNDLSTKIKIELGNFTLNVELDIPIHGFMVLFGRSGSGKTTFLRCLSGLERAPDGYLKIGNEIWQDESQGIFVPASERKIGYVFQESRLFPHLNVEGNLRYGFKRRDIKNGERFFNQVVNIMGLEVLINRNPNKLSGGEKKRVALARALLANPRLLLMDEPLVGIDSKLKNEILPYFQRMQSELNIPVFYVTHSLNESLQLANTMLLMDKGKIITTGSIEDVFLSPDLGLHLEPALVGSVLDTTVVQQDEEFQLTILKFKEQTLYVPRRTATPGSKLRIHIRAEDVTLAIAPIQNQTSVLNVLPAWVVATRTSSKDNCKIEVELDIGFPLLATITRKSLSQLNIKSGQKVYAHIKAIRMAHEYD